MAKITPTIGRVVWFTPSPGSGPAHFGQPLTASIAFVHSADCINVGGFDANGMPFSATSVRLVQDGEPKPEYGHYAEWMPYQKAQADLQREIADSPTKASS